MNLILKHVCRNIRDHKFRTFIIIFAVSIASALFFVSTTITNTTLQIFEQGERRFSGTSDLKVEKEVTNSQDPYFSLIDVSEAKYSIGFLEIQGFFKESTDNDVNVKISGADFDDILTMNTLNLKNGKKGLSDNSAIIGNQLAEKYNINIGDTITLFIYGQNKEFEVTGIAYDEGIFRDDGKTTLILVAKDTLGEILGQKDKVNIQYIKLIDTSNVSDKIDSLMEKNNGYEISESVSSESSEQTTKMITLVFNLVTIIVILLGVFIISSTFKTIILERLPVIGTFRSIGATKKSTTFIMMSESVLYGITGGLIGSALGLVLLHVISKIIAEDWGGSEESTVAFGPLNLIFAFLIAIIIVSVSSAIPIIKASKLSLKDLIFNKNENTITRFSFVRFIIILLMFLFTQIAPYVISGNAIMAIDGISIFLLIALIPLATPYIVRFFVWFINKISNIMHNQIAGLAAKNLRDDKNVGSNTVMLAIGIACLLMIITVANDVITQITDTFSSANYNITLAIPNYTDKDIDALKATDGVEDYMGVYQNLNVKVNGGKSSISYLEGVNAEEYADYFSMTYYKEKESIVKKLNTGKYIILNRTFRNSLNVSAGDTIELQIDSKTTRKYEVLAFMDTMWVGGSYGIISDENMKEDFHKSYYDSFWVRTSKDAKIVVKKLKQTFYDKSISAIPTTDQRDSIVNANSIMFVVVNAFSILAIIIGTIGVFNNILLSFLKRKKALTLYRSIGMSKAQLTQMILLESLNAGLLGGLIGVLFGILLIRLTAAMLSEVIATVTMTYSITRFLVCIVIGLIITTIATVSPLRKTLKADIISTLKFE